MFHFSSLGGKTENYQLFIKKRQILLKHLHRLHPSTINIQYFTKSHLSAVINENIYK